jgi:iron-sulfur cluster repair protein YtfE (RIC family)
MGLRSLEEDLHLHIYLESHLLFPRAVALEAVAVEG